MCNVAERRIDPDYVPTDYELENATRLLYAAAKVGLPFHYKNGNGQAFQKWVLGLMLMLVVAGVTGVATVEYTVVQRLSVLETKVDILLLRK